MRNFKILAALLLSSSSSAVFAEDIAGTWKNIDDKTGSSKAIIEIRQETNGTYTAKIVKVTPRPGYTAKETCVNCPAPYTNIVKLLYYPYRIRKKLEIIHRLSRSTILYAYV